MSDKDRTNLEKTFDLPHTTDPRLQEKLDELFKYSEHPELNEVARMALAAYKDMMLDIQNFEPKYRARSLEVAAQYLNLAKDALAKEKDLEIKEKKTLGSGNPEETPEESETIDRNEILLELDKQVRGKV